MTKLIPVGRSVFAVGICGLALLCIAYNDFIVGRPPAWPEGVNLNPGLAWCAAILLIASSFAIGINRKIILASLTIASLIFLFSALRIIPQFMDNWLAGYKTMALFGGALIMAGSGSNVSNKMRTQFVLTGSVFLGIFFVASGYAHIKFAAFVTDFIPAYIPFHTFWMYFTAACLIGGGVGIFVPRIRKWAALLSALMLTGWFLFLHIPRFMANTTNASDRMGLCESFTFAGIFFVLSGIFQEWKKSEPAS